MLLHYKPHSPIHTHSTSNIYNVICTHYFYHTDSSTDGSVGFSVLPKNTSTCGLGKPGIKPPILQLANSCSSSWAKAYLALKSMYIFQFFQCFFRTQFPSSNGSHALLPITNADFRAERWWEAGWSLSSLIWRSQHPWLWKNKIQMLCSGLTTKLFSYLFSVRFKLAFAHRKWQHFWIVFTYCFFLHFRALPAVVDSPANCIHKQRFPVVVWDSLVISMAESCF